MEQDKEDTIVVGGGDGEDMTTTTTSMTTTGSSSAIPQGRTVRLHFRCRAELALGSQLHVTTTILDENDSNDNNNNSGKQPPKAQPHEQQQFDNEDITTTPLTVPMYTTPDTYPVWKTRRPVVVVLHKTKGIQHFYYRYQVLTPGATSSTSSTAARHNHHHHHHRSTSASSLATSLSSSVVIQIQTDLESGETKSEGNNTNDDGSETGSTILEKSRKTFSTAMASPTSSFGSYIKWEQPFDKHITDMANLPYRTINIDVATARVQPLLLLQGEQEEEEEEGNNEEGEEEKEENEVDIDTFNNKEDVSFSSYLIREAVHQENRTRLMAEHSQSNASMEGGLGGALGGGRGAVGGTVTPPPPSFGGPLRQRIFFVCFHLPVVVVKKDNQWQASWSESILAKTEGSQVVSQYEAHWIGTVTTHPPLASEQDRDEVRSVLAQLSCTPLFLDDSVRQAHYYGFCKQILWPAFHNVDILDLSVLQQQSWDQSRLQGWWTAYQAVNQTFANLMATLVRPHDIVWVHDYHLSLLPKLLHNQEVVLQKTKNPNNTTNSNNNTNSRALTRKVFFLHIPFPTSQIFRELECGEDLLEGILHANVVGFHTFDHTRHFLNASKRILGLTYETLVGGLIGVHIRGRTVMVTMANVSIEPPLVDAALSLPSVQHTADQYRNVLHPNRTVIGGLDIGQGLQGVALKFLAYERLLRDYPSWVPRVVMMQRVLVPGSRAQDEQQTLAELRVIVARIQANYGPDVMDYQEIPGTSLPLDQRLALWRSADVLMVTPIREGLNHWPMEYVYAHKEPSKPGVVIASEFSAVASILNGALRVNPYDIQMTVTTIDKALTMDLSEREGRRYRDMYFVSSSPSGKWVKNVLRDLKDAIALGAESQSGTSSSSTPSVPPLYKDHKGVLDTTTAAYLSREAALAFLRVNHSAMKAAYDRSQHRVFVLDFNGTIIIKEPPGKYLKREILGTSGNKPQPHVVEALTQLCADARNTVYVVSGDSAENVLNALGHVPGLGLGVSNGAHFSPPALPHQRERSWYMFDLGVDWDAVKRVALPVLSKYTARSNGSFVKLTRFSIGWSYYSCDPEWGFQQASHLVMELESELAAFDVRFVTLKGVVEVVPRRLNKGLFCKKVLRDAGREEPVDFVLCMGDDVSDETMFASVYSYVSEIGDEPCAQATPPVVTTAATGNKIAPVVVEEAPLVATVPRDPLYAYTVAVGKKPTLASHWVHDAHEVGELLLTLTGGVLPKKEETKDEVLFGE